MVPADPDFLLPPPPLAGASHLVCISSSFFLYRSLIFFQAFFTFSAERAKNNSLQSRKQYSVVLKCKQIHVYSLTSCLNSCCNFFPCSIPLISILIPGVCQIKNLWIQLYCLQKPTFPVELFLCLFFLFLLNLICLAFSNKIFQLLTLILFYQNLLHCHHDHLV